MDIINLLVKKFNMSRLAFFLELIPVKDSVKLLSMLEEGIINRQQTRIILHEMVNERVNIILKIILRDNL